MTIKTLFALTDRRNRHTTFAHILGGIAIGLITQFIRFVALLQLVAGPLVFQFYCVISVILFCQYVWYRQRKDSRLHPYSKAFLLVAIAAATGVAYMTAMNFIFKVW